MSNRGILVEKQGDEFVCSVKDLDMPVVEEGEILIKVSYSSLNYKDALSSIGNPGVSRNFPHITGVDLAGEIVESNGSHFSVGDKVVVTGYDLGMHTKGGHAKFVKVPASWALTIPESLDESEIMSLGTAGLTAALSINELLDSKVTPNHGKIVVTGATGGVGSLVVAILAKLGFSVVAVTGKEEKIKYLNSIGADQVLLRDKLDLESKKPMLKGAYAGIIDTVGGKILAYFLKTLKYDGVATCCGLTSSHELPTNVFPFILRGVRLIGIDSVECSLEKKEHAWKKLAKEYKLNTLESLTTKIILEEVPPKLQELLLGRAVGRYLVKVGDN